MANTLFYSKTALTGGSALALDYIDGNLLAGGDIAHVFVSGICYIYKLDASSSVDELSPDIIVPDTNPGTKRWKLQQSYGYLPTNHLSGLGLSHAADTDHDITIAIGMARDSTDAQGLVLAAALTKQADAAWAVGTNAGGMDTGSIPASGTLHVWLIKRSDTGVVDALFSISATSPTMPANYNYKRRIGSYRTNASNNIINGDWWGTGLLRTFLYDTPILDVSSATPGTSAVTAALSTPGGIITKAILNFAQAVNTSGVQAYLSALANADLAPSATVAPLATGGSILSGAPTIGLFGHAAAILTDTSSQIRYRSSANVGIYITTLGWEEAL